MNEKHGAGSSNPLLQQLEAWIAANQKYACVRQYPHPRYVADFNPTCTGCLIEHAALELRKRAADETDEGDWVIVYADQDRLTEHFSGAGADAAARGRFEQLKMAWTCRLFRCVDKTGYGPAQKAFVQLCAPHGKDWLTCPECAKAALGKGSAP